MKKTIVVCGHGPGISDAVARKFGAEGYAVALVARNAERLAAAVKSLAEAGIEAKAFPADLAVPAQVKGAIQSARALGPVHVVHYNAYAGGAGDLSSADPLELRGPLDVGVVGLVAAVQAALPDLTETKGALLVTGGGLSTYDAKIDAMAVDWRAMGLAVSKAAQHKTVGLFAAQLGRLGIYVGEVTVLGAVKGTAFDPQGKSSLEASRIADKFWEQFQKRTDTFAKIA